MNRPSAPSDAATREAQVHAIVVTYHPKADDLGALLDVLIPQVARTIVVDNTSGQGVVRALVARHAESLQLIEFGENLGIAHAQNVGIEAAMVAGATHVLLMDQDSVAAPDMVEGLLQGLGDQAREGAPPVAAIGPVSIDRRTGALSFFWRSASRPYRWQPVLGDPAVVEVEFLIASGTLIPVDVLRQVGGMRSAYFIDHVDTEWCFRAKGAGYRLLGSTAARMHHQLGDKVHNFWFLRTRQVAHHVPLRDYYMFRNTLLMLGDVSLSLYWRWHLLLRLLQFSTFFLLFGSDRLQRARSMLRGMRHGVRRRAGRVRPDGGLDAVASTSLDPGPGAGARAPRAQA